MKQITKPNEDIHVQEMLAFYNDARSFEIDQI